MLLLYFYGMEILFVHKQNVKFVLFVWTFLLMLETDVYIVVGIAIFFLEETIFSPVDLFLVSGQCLPTSRNNHC